MSLLIGFSSLIVVLSIITIIAVRLPSISKIILVSAVVRLIFILIHTFFHPLPDSGQDAMGIERLAWSWAKEGFENIFEYFPGYNSFFYTWLIALIYSIFGRVILVIQSLSLLFGVGSVILVWLIGKKIWDETTANKCAWITALFPTLILYSALPLREVYNSFFLLLAIWGLVGWYRDRNIKYFLIAISGFICASFFHAVLLIGGIAFLLLVGISSFKKSLILLIKGKINIFAVVISLMLFSFSYLYLSNNIYIPYLGKFEQMIDVNWLKFSINVRMRGEASYPEWLMINSFLEIIYKGIIRVFYLLYSPFPWQITKLSHLIGVFDSILYILVSYYICLNFNKIWNDDCLKLILFILIGYLFIYGLGVSNFGAGIRHRSKFICELILLAGPMIPRLVFYSKKLVN